jgi:hypothetical protein
LHVTPYITREEAGRTGRKLFSQALLSFSFGDIIEIVIVHQMSSQVPVYWRKKHHGEMIVKKF